MVGWGEAVASVRNHATLQFSGPGYAAPTIANMNDGQFFSAYSVIDKKWIASGREHANAGNISFPPEPWTTREQLTC